MKFSATASNFRESPGWSSVGIAHLPSDRFRCGWRKVSFLISAVRAFALLLLLTFTINPVLAEVKVGKNILTVLPPDGKPAIKFVEGLGIITKEPAQSWSEDRGFLYTLDTIGKPWPFLDSERLETIWDVSPIPIDVSFAFDSDRPGIVIHKIIPNSVGACRRILNWEGRKISKDAELEIKDLSDAVDQQFQSLGIAESPERLGKELAIFYKHYDTFHEKTSTIVHDLSDVTTKEALLRLTDGIRKERVLWRRLAENATGKDGVIMPTVDQWEAVKAMFAETTAKSTGSLDSGVRYKLDDELAIPEVTSSCKPQQFRFSHRHVDATVAVFGGERKLLGSASFIGDGYFITCAHEMVKFAEADGSEPPEKFDFASEIGSPHEMGAMKDNFYTVQVAFVGESDFCILKLSDGIPEEWSDGSRKPLPLATTKKPILETYRFMLVGHPKNNGGFKQVAINGFVKFPEELKKVSLQDLMKLAEIQKKPREASEYAAVYPEKFHDVVVDDRYIYVMPDPQKRTRQLRGWGGACYAPRGMSGAAAVSIDGGPEMEGRIIGVLSRGPEGPSNGRPIVPSIIHHERFVAAKAIRDELKKAAMSPDDEINREAKAILATIDKVSRSASKW